MDNILEFFQKLFDPSGFPARWQCGKGWTDFHGWLYIISDLLIWSAYFAISIIIVTFITKRKDARFHKVYFLFAAFILSCGFTHLLDAIIFWYPVYRLSALVLLITGLLSWFTVYNLVKLIPIAFTLKTSQELEAEVEIRKKVELDLESKIAQMNEAQAIAKMGSWEWDIKTNRVTWSAGMFHVYDLQVIPDGLTFDQYLSYIHPDDKTYVDNSIKEAYQKKNNFEYFHRILTAAGNVKTLQAKGEIILDAGGQIVKMIGTGQDVSEQKKIEHEMLIKTHDLQEVNTELQKFAYIASHDLQEPLRKIKTYLSRLESENLSLQTDVKSKIYMSKMSSAETRMQQLMQDILNFSRLSSASIVYQKTDLNDLLQMVLSDVEISIQTSGALIKIGKLPTIDANESQWLQLFQNLIANAIKFRKSDSFPQIEILAELVNGQAVGHLPLKTHYKFSEWDEKYYWAKEQFCQITILDQGIGLDPEYYERIFTPFERLHNVSQYEGTGIGLAICRKIVEYHHGVIFVNSSEKGTLFTVVVPVSQTNFESQNAR